MPRPPFPHNPFTGTASWDECFLESLKRTQYFLYERRWLSQFLAVLLWRKLKKERSFCLLLWNHFLFLKADYDPENGSKSRLWNWTLEKIHQWQKRGAGTEILMWLSEQSWELVSIFKEASRPLTRPSNIFKTICACCTDVLIKFNLMGFQTNFISWHSPFKHWGRFTCRLMWDVYFIFYSI